jgi:uncharacterized protein YceH (UPF0502 family)
LETEATPKSAGPWPVLDLLERRVLGVLVEKAKTTPDAYPLSVNATVTGCNQKSNREPILNVSDVEVEETLIRLQRRGYVDRVQGGRVERWRHLLYAAWNADKIELAILAELLLRGPQTEGELRGRASRMEPIDDLEALRARLGPLAERNLVVYLTPPDRRGAMLTHGFHATDELQKLRRGAESLAAMPPLDTAASRPAAAPSELTQEVDSLRQRIVELENSLRTVQEEVRLLKQSLGG